MSGLVGAKTGTAKLLVRASASLSLPKEGVAARTNLLQALLLHEVQAGVAIGRVSRMAAHAGARVWVGRLPARQKGVKVAREAAFAWHVGVALETVRVGDGHG
jgi:hypothetical protein